MSEIYVSHHSPKTQFNWVKGTHDDSTISQNILSENVQRYENKYSTLKLESPPQA